MSGREAYEVLCEEMVMDRSVGSRYLLVISDRLPFIVARPTCAEYYEQAGPRFAEVVGGFAATTGRRESDVTH